MHLEKIQQLKEPVLQHIYNWKADRSISHNDIAGSNSTDQVCICLSEVRVRKLETFDTES